MLIDYKNKEITCFIVYYGPALAGRSTNIEQMHTIINNKNISIEEASKLNPKYGIDLHQYSSFGIVKIAYVHLPKMIITKDDFIDQFNIKFLLQAGTGPYGRNPSRELMLFGADGVIFVADSRSFRMNANLESMWFLKHYLENNGQILEKLPYVLQLNKRDIQFIDPIYLKHLSTNGVLVPDYIMSVEELLKELRQNDEPFIEAIAYKGIGVYESFEIVANKIYEKILAATERYK